MSVESHPSRNEWNAAIRNLEGNASYCRSRAKEWSERTRVRELTARAVELERVIAYMKQHKPYLKRPVK